MGLPLALDRQLHLVDCEQSDCEPSSVLFPELLEVPELRLYLAEYRDRGDRLDELLNPVVDVFSLRHELLDELQHPHVQVLPLELEPSFVGRYVFEALLLQLGFRDVVLQFLASPDPTNSHWRKGLLARSSIFSISSRVRLLIR